MPRLKCSMYFNYNSLYCFRKKSLLHFNFSVNSGVLRRRKRDIDGTSANVETTFHLDAHGDRFVLNVKHTEPVLHPDARILFTSKDFSQVWQGTNPDCFMTGKVTSHDAQTVVFSFCDNLVNTLFRIPCTYDSLIFLLQNESEIF